MARRRSMYLDRPSTRRSSYSSYRHEGRGLLFKIGLTLLALVVVAVGLGAYQLSRGVPTQRVTRAYGSTLTAAGTATNLPWPRTGQAAVAVEGGGVMSWPVQQPRPAAIASLAKMMTAYQVLLDHPLTVGAGPSVTVTARDVADYRYRLSQSQSVLTVRAGERLDELQLLQALLIPSANNIAVILARWDAGSVSKFVAKMNATAQRLGLAHTRYVDPDGSAERTVSTAVDQLTLAQKVMAIPTFARIVSQPAATFPLAGKLFNFDYLIGHRGVVGIKTGSESAAGGCWAFAARRTVDGKPALVFGVVLGQRAKKTGELIQPALDAGLRLIDATPRVVKRVTLVADGTTVGSLSAPWRRSDIALQTKGAISVVAAPGQQYDVKLDLRAPASTSIAAGTVVGRLTVAGAAVPVVVAKDASGPTLKWRLTRL